MESYDVWFDVTVDGEYGEYVTSHHMQVQGENEVHAIRRCGEEIRSIMRPGGFRNGKEGRALCATFDFIAKASDVES